jgi:iron complex outermembrane recepter protein
MKRNWVMAASVAATGAHNAAEAQATETEPLEEVVVTTEFFRPVDASSATKFDLAVQDTPQAISVLTDDILSTFGTADLLAVDKFIAGLHSTGNGASTTYFLGYMQARGFVLDELSGYKINGFSTIREFQPDLAVAERVEFVKGPSSVVYGVNNYGGTINTVLKAPLARPEYNVSANLGSYGTHRITGDATGPLNDDGSVRYRVITAWEDRRSIKNDFEFQRFPLYGRLQWDISPETTVDTYVFYQKEDSVDDFGAIAGLNDDNEIVEPFGLDRNIFLGDSTYNEIGRESLQAYGSISHKFAGDYVGTLKTGYVQNTHDYQSIYLYNYGYFQGPNADVYTKFDSRDISSWDAELSFGGDFELFGRSHQFMLLAESRIIRFDFTLFPFDVLGTVNQYNPDFSSVNPPNPAVLLVSNGNFNQDEDRYAIGGQTLLNVTDRLSLLFGLRWDRIKQNTVDLKFDPDPNNPPVFDENNIQTNQTKTNVTPRLGFVYKVTPQINAYASYSEGFVPQQGVTRGGGTIDPETGLQIEAGFKGEFADGKLGASLIGFFIERRDVVVSDPTNDRDLNEDFRVQGREQEHRGVELEIFGRVAPNLNLIATYAHLDTEITKDDLSFDEADTSLGNAVGGAPRTAGSLFLEYEIPSGPLRALSISGGAAYVGKRPSQERNIKARFGLGGGYPIFHLSDYTTVDLGLTYRGIDNLTISVQATNLFDEDYFNQAQVPDCCSVNFLQRGTSRELELGVAYRF